MDRKAIQEQIEILYEHMGAEELNLAFIESHARFIADLAAFESERTETRQPVVSRIQNWSAAPFSLAYNKG